MNQKWSRLIKQQSVLIACSFFCGFMLLARVYSSKELVYSFMIWNLFLASIPMVFALLVSHFTPRSKVGCAVLFLLWLLFFPNSTYMISDLLHLTHRTSTSVPGWYDAAMLFFFALTGLFIGVVSLNYVHSYLRTIFSKIWAWAIVSCSIFLSGFGVYLGRFLRWNSWDVIGEPMGLLKDVFDRIIHPMDHFQTYIVTFVFTVILFFAYFLFVSSKERI